MTADQRAKAVAFLRALADFYNQQGVLDMASCGCCNGTSIDLGGGVSLSDVVVDPDTAHADEGLVVARHPNAEWVRLEGLVKKHELRVSVDWKAFKFAGSIPGESDEDLANQYVTVPRVRGIPFGDLCQELCEAVEAFWPPS